MENVREKCYEKFGSLSKVAINILTEAKKHNNIHSLCFELGVGYKFIKDVLDDYCEISGEHYMFRDDYLLQSDFASGKEIDFESICGEIEKIVSKFDKHKMNLDHVSAVPETLVKRAKYIIDNHDVANCKILFLGDHDFSSIALAYTLSKVGFNDYKIEVLDIDDDVLNFIAQAARDFKLNIKVLYSDFRLGCPLSAQRSFDVVFTDPPYTPVGMSLFLLRAIECSKDKFATIYLCYKSAELSPAIGYKVQRAMQKLSVYFKEIIANFNVYKKAEALGYRSDLYVCNILPKAFDKLEYSEEYDIYTHGKKSLEASSQVAVNFNDIASHICKNDAVNENNLLFILNKQEKDGNSMSVSNYLKQKENKTLSHSQDCVYVIDFTYQLKDVLNLRTLIMANKDVQYGVFTGEQAKELYSGRFDVILELYDLTEYTLNNIKLIRFTLKESVKNSMKSVLIYRNSNIKNAFVSVATKILGITKNEARASFFESQVANCAENFVFQLSYSDLTNLKNFLDSIKV